MATSVKVVSGDLQRGLHGLTREQRSAFGYASDPAWVQAVGDRVDMAADLLLARLRAVEALNTPKG